MGVGISSRHLACHSAFHLHDVLRTASGKSAAMRWATRQKQKNQKPTDKSNNIATETNKAPTRGKHSVFCNICTPAVAQLLQDALARLELALEHHALCNLQEYYCKTVLYCNMRCATFTLLFRSLTLFSSSSLWRYLDTLLQ